MASLKKRGKTYYAQYYIGTKQKRVSLGTDSLQVAKEKIRQIESALVRGTDIPLPTKTPTSKVVNAYCDYLLTVKTARNAQRISITCEKPLVLSVRPWFLKMNASAPSVKNVRARITQPIENRLGCLVY
ncbi:hypothetical protein [Syntrophotalea carbinolica]|uniref:hypothetical protein n=1 Tax=Syntrophotalea carbinolica TaxID=19 RepID=UPI00005C973E|nr:hypothetical protein [Syntrophotalea carbinolica]